MKVPSEMQHIVLLIIVMLIFGFLERIYLHRKFENWVEDILEDQKSSLSSFNEDLSSKLDEIKKISIIFNDASNCGLFKIYKDRRSAKDDILNSIINSEYRVYLLGVSFSEDISIKNLSEILASKISDKPSYTVKVLMLDALRSPAIYRSLVESNEEDRDKIIEDNRNCEFELNRYFDTRMYKDFSDSIGKLKNMPNLTSSVKFYAHMPTCWMVVVDNAVYFQPYTLGTCDRYIESHKENRCFGAAMPVYKFLNTSNSDTYEILEDHFNKTWSTSNIDMFHAGYRDVGKVGALKKIIMERGSWFEHVCKSLSETKKYERMHIRQKCHTKNKYQIEIENNNCKVSGKLVDFSSGNIGVELTDKDHKFTINDEVVVTKPIAKSSAAEFIFRNLIDDCGGQYIVKRIEDELSVISKNKKIVKLGLEAAFELNTKNKIDTRLKSP
ncbi:MAG: hypothetical protein OEZ39_08080 [Gammaproteobacteria bacterium]|nr:hypothetical protein [Gammaproteobacteria bacterium]MDH5651819.1 hypothetical protein [Gammaproteobacteria bacterium]